MDNIPLITVSVLILMLIKLSFAGIRRKFNFKKTLIEGLFDVFGSLMFYIYPFIFDLLLLGDGSSRNTYILEWNLLSRVILAFILLFGIPSLLSFAKQYIFHKIQILSGPYFWIGNTSYFLLVVPFILFIANGVISKL